MYKISKFFIAQKIDNNKVALYSTLTTSIIILDNRVYEDIFQKKHFDKRKTEVDTLIQMGFIIAEEFDELKYLYDVRKKSKKYMNSQGTPYYLITPTMDCNARCYYCFEHGCHHDKMSFETAKNVVDFIKTNAPSKDVIIQWFGGEPLLATDIISFITNSLKKNDFTISSKITTNGFLISEDILEEAIENWGTDVIQITLDGLGNDYNRIKKFKIEKPETAFDTVIRNIQLILDSGIKMRVRINFDPQNQEPAIRIIKYLDGKFSGYKNLFVYFAPIDSENIPSISNDFDELSEHPLISMLNIKENFAGMAQTHRGITELNEMQLNRYYLHPISLSCTGVYNRNVTIDSHGDLYVCHRLLGKGEKYSSGNVVDGFIENEIRKTYQSIELEDERCYNCNILPLCQGGCKFRRYTYSHESACSNIKAIAGKLLARAINKMDVN